MRSRQEKSGLVVQAVAGTYVVILGWDLTDAKLKKGLLGFAIQREDKTENETYWLRGMKTFPDAIPKLPPSGDASSHDQPYQSFQWADYSAKPEHDYLYTVIAMYGEPDALKDGVSVAIPISTEVEWADPSTNVHSVFFNRAAVASQEYARRFQDKQPDQVPGDAAFRWLSRGLEEAILAFIARANGSGFGLRVAIYEFQYAPILEALGVAAKTGADVQVVYDAIENHAGEPVNSNDEAIAAAKITRICRGVTRGKIMHNKFIVLTKGGAPIAVWTGSTNFTVSGIYGQLNVGHTVFDPGVAKRYLDSWGELARDPEIAAVKGWNENETPDPAAAPAKGVAEVFSPRSNLEALNRYGQIAGSASKGLFMTFAFGMGDVFLKTYQKKDRVLRFALMDTAGVGKQAAQARKDIAALRTQGNAVVAIGQNIVMNEFDRWVKELPGLKVSAHVRWVHTKFMLVDPLSDDPIVVTGSANFSKASTTDNHENMLVIRGDTRTADIYVGEFMRQFSSYAFRDAAAAAAKGGDPRNFTPQDLVPDDSWVANYFKAGTSRALRRVYFSGGAPRAGAVPNDGGGDDGAEPVAHHQTRGKTGGRGGRRRQA